jgi:hypothetical protein
MKTTLCSLLVLTVQLPVFAGGSEEFVAHEWGTFTSVQGADGIQMEWNPLVTSELPGFVHDTKKPLPDTRRYLTGFGGKEAFRSLQRMETPVIYFYSDRERVVDVTVRFPQGLVTEWYPQVTDIGPSAVQARRALVKLDEMVGRTGLQPDFNFASLDTGQGIADSRIRWSDVAILPAREGAAASRRLPLDGSGSHYYAARETDAAMLRVDSLAGGQPAVEHERFLFYRGIGNFPTPLAVKPGPGEESLELHNTGAEDLEDLFVLYVRHGQGKFIELKRLAAGGSERVRLAPSKDTEPLAGLGPRLSQRMADALTRQGLFAREATAMVETWRDSWFEEQGVRVLYTLSRAWTDRILPLTIEPSPRSLVRVMVGRAEVITPGMEAELAKQVTRYGKADEASRSEVVEATRQLGLGRFLEPAMRRLTAWAGSADFNRNCWELLAAAGKPPGNAIAQR